MYEISYQYNDGVFLNNLYFLEVFSQGNHFCNSPNESILKRIIEKVETRQQVPKLTHFEKAITQHEATITLLKTFNSGDSTALFYRLKTHLREEKGERWFFSSYHLKRLLEAIEQKEERYVVQSLYARMYESIIFASVYQNEKGDLEKLIHFLIEGHEMIIQELQEDVKKTRLRMLFG